MASKKKNKTAEELLAEKAKKDPKKAKALDKEIEKATKTKKEIPKPEVFIKDLKQAIKDSKIGSLVNWVPRVKRTAIKFKGNCVWYVLDTTRGIHIFKRKLGTRLNSGYLVTHKEMDTFMANLEKEVTELDKKYKAEQAEASKEAEKESKK